MLSSSSNLSPDEVMDDLPRLTLKNALRLRCKSNSSSSWNLLPNELHMDILSRLTFKNTLRLRCISKSWKYLIESRDFQRIHQNRLNAASSLSIVFSALNSDGIVYKFRPTESISNKIAGINHSEKLPHKLSKDSRLVVGSCNGVLCILTYDYDEESINKIVLWNPLFRNCTITLPTPWVQNMFTYYAFGFGYNAVMEDFIVVWWEKVNGTTRCAFFSLKSWTWKNICPGIRFPESLSGLFINTHIYWITGCYPQYVNAFNLATERFEEVPLPPTDLTDDLFILNSGIFYDCLCLTTRNYQDASYDIWIMKTHGVRDYWMKIKIEIEEIYWKLVPLTNQYYVHNTSGSSRQIIIMWNGENTLLCYDVKGKSLVDTVIYNDCCCHDSDPGDVFHYVETMELRSSIESKTSCKQCNSG